MQCIIRVGASVYILILILFKIDPREIKLIRTPSLSFSTLLTPNDGTLRRWYICLFSSLAGLQGLFNAQNRVDDQVGGPEGGHGQYHRSAGKEVRSVGGC